MQKRCIYHSGLWAALEQKSIALFCTSSNYIALPKLRTCACFPVTSVPRVASTAVWANSIAALCIHVTGGRRRGTFINICACFPVTSVPRVASAAVWANSIAALCIYVTGGRRRGTFVNIWNKNKIKWKHKKRKHELWRSGGYIAYKMAVLWRLVTTHLNEFW